MIRIEISEELQQALKDILEQVSADGQQVVLTAKGIELAAVIPMGDFNMLNQYEDMIEGQWADEAAAEPGESVPYDQVRKDLGLA